MLKKDNVVLVVKGFIAILLLLCLIETDYIYYQIIRILISFSFAFLVYNSHKKGDKRNAIIFLCCLLIFQPLIKIALGREIWLFIDLIVASFMIYQIFNSSYISCIPITYKTNSPTITQQYNCSSQQSQLQKNVDNISSKW